MNKVDWSKAPVSATHYGGDKFWRMHDSGNFWEIYSDSEWYYSLIPPAAFIDYCERPQAQPKPTAITQEPLNKYSRQIVGLDGKTCQIDVYRVLDAFGVTSREVGDAVKSLLSAGDNPESRKQKLQEAVFLIEAELNKLEQQEEIK